MQFVGSHVFFFFLLSPKEYNCSMSSFVVERYSNCISAVQVVEYRCWWLRIGDFHLEDKECPGQPKKFKNMRLKPLLVKDPN